MIIPLIVFLFLIVPDKDFNAKVIKITDGDTIHVLSGTEIYIVRLDAIDAPERGQKFGKEAAKTLYDKIYNKNVLVNWQTLDRYNRMIAEIYLGDRRICLEMVQEGMAWHYVKYSKDKDLAKAEKEAREAKIGIWSDPNPIPPWEYRQGRR